VTKTRTYRVRLLVPAIFLIEAKNDEDAVKKVAEFSTGYYTQDLRDWMEPMPEPEDVR
jgi:hypothetical protein